MDLTALRLLVNSDTNIADNAILEFTNTLDQEWSSWIQWQGAIQMDSPVLDRNCMIPNNTWESENLYTVPEGTGEDMICHSSYSSPCFLFDDPSPPPSNLSSKRDDASLPLKNQMFPLEDASVQLNNQMLPLDHPASPLKVLRFPAAEPSSFLQPPPSPKLEPSFHSFLEVAEFYEKQPALAGTRTSGWQEPTAPDPLLNQSDDTSTPRTRTRKRATQQRKASMASGVPRSRRKHGYTLDSHNEIEKRYRTGINECINNLRQAIPLLLPKNSEFGFGEEDDGSITEKESKPTLRKDGKGEVITRALEYIKLLEADANRLGNEAAVLNTRLRVFEDPAMNKTAVEDDSGLLCPARIVRRVG